MNGPPFSHSCVPVSVERVNKDEDKDENVDADQTRTGRPVKWATNRFAYSGDRKRCLVWSRKHKLKNGETCEWTSIQPELCASVC